ncbi:hypothetical protein ACFJIW_02190 [Tahibacter sp. UC22_41]|uniref:hypothetical protein n=1 Tax=Tahibacter sp. UC22_41 TaxID=3350178 RepID=UPI0036DE1463
MSATLRNQPASALMLAAIRRRFKQPARDHDHGRSVSRPGDPDIPARCRPGRHMTGHCDRCRTLLADDESR